MTQSRYRPSEMIDQQRGSRTHILPKWTILPTRLLAATGPKRNFPAAEEGRIVAGAARGVNCESDFRKCGVVRGFALLRWRALRIVRVAQWHAAAYFAGSARLLRGVCV